MKNECLILFFLLILSCLSDEETKTADISVEPKNDSSEESSVSTPRTNLPSSMKGYEIYSWMENEEICFTLITGTNRNKTFEEITSAEETKSIEGFYKIRVKGVEEIKKLLELLPKGTEVFWTTLEATEGYSKTDKTFNPVDPKIIEELKTFYKSLVLKK